MSGRSPSKTVECFRGDTLVRHYRFSYGETIAPLPPPTDQIAINEAKTSLSIEGVAFPPFHGIRFVVRND